MSQNTPWTMQDWGRLVDGAGGGFDLVLHAAFRRAMIGDVDSMTSLMRFCRTEQGEPLNGFALIDFSALNLALPLTLRLPDDGEPGEVKFRVENVTLMQCVALSMLWDEPLDSSASYDTGRVKRALGAGEPLLRQHWRDKDDVLIREAVQTWQDGEHIVRRFFCACARFARHPRMVDAFIAAGTDVAALFDYREDENMIEKDPFAGMAAVPAMINAGSCAAAARLLQEVRIQGLDRTMPKGVLRAFLDTSHGAEPSQVRDWDRCVARLKLGPLPGEAASTPREAGSDMGRVAAGTVELLDELAEVEDPTREAWLARAITLQHYLRSIDERGLTADTAFVDAMLTRPYGPGKTLLQSMLDVASTWKDHHRDSRMAVSELVMAAGATHCVPALRALAPVIAALQRREDASSGALLKAVAMAGDKDSAMARHSRLVPEAFRQSLQLLKALGVELNAPFEDEWRKTAAQSTLLHALAESDHPDMCAALVVALEEGCDPTVRNGRKWLASSSVANPRTKQRWLEIERSHAARQQAQAALADTLGLVEGGRP